MRVKYWHYVFYVLITTLLGVLLGVAVSYSPSTCGREVSTDWAPEKQFVGHFKNLQCVKKIGDPDLSFDDILLTDGGGVKVCVDDLGTHDQKQCTLRVMRTQIDLLQLEAYQTVINTDQPAVTLGWRKVGSVGDPASTAKLVYTMFQ